VTAAAVLAEARAAGVRLHATPEGELHWRCRGPLPERLRQLLAAHKPELLALMREEGDRLNTEWLELWEERSAIMEYDGKLPREQAEAQALADVLRQMRR
jgi:hypothetical protein